MMERGAVLSNLWSCESLREGVAFVEGAMDRAQVKIEEMSSIDHEILATSQHPYVVATCM